MAKPKSEIDAIRALTEVTIKGFEQVAQALVDMRSSGKSRTSNI